MPYIRKRGNVFYYDRRVPKAVSNFDQREKVRISLHTDSEKIAEERSFTVNSEVEAYWKQLIQTGATHTEQAFHHIVEMAQLLGFTYKSSDEIAKGSMTEILNRLQAVQQIEDDSVLVEAKLGGANAPTMTISQSLEKYFEITKNELIDKSESQIQDWQNGHKRSIRNFINICGNKELKDISRDDIILFRDWWINRIEEEGRNPNTANKDMRGTKNVIVLINNHMKLGLDTDWLFEKYSLKDPKKTTRQPFETNFIQNRILDLSYHENLNDEAKCILYALADTGARPSEIVGLLSENIILDHTIPHIKIRSKKGRMLKNRYSERDLPLVGCSLWAFQKMPEGFPRYREKKAGADTLSALLNKHLRAQNLLPSEDHTVYSLRHSFQDRLTNEGVPDRIQVQLMGHKFEGRIEYGKGGTLEAKRDYLLKTCFKPPCL